MIGRGAALGEPVPAPPGPRRRWAAGPLGRRAAPKLPKNTVADTLGIAREVAMELNRVVCRECCTVLEGTSKSEALLELIERLAKHNHVKDAEGLKREVFYREQLMSTGIGLGVAVPHARYHEITEPVVAVGLQPKGLADYQAIDDERVRIVFLILVGPQQHKEYVRLLALIVRTIKDGDTKGRLVAASSGAQIYNVLAASD
jgi:nitrogen PTS system EIIA component